MEILVYISLFLTSSLLFYLFYEVDADAEADGERTVG